MNKKILAIGNQNGIQKVVCPKCGAEMQCVDTYMIRFMAGDISEKGGIIWMCTSCDYEEKE